MMTVSPAGRALIVRNEGLRLKAYQDVVGVWTIGYGDTGSDVWPGLTISREEADRRLDERLANDFGLNVNEEIGDRPTTQAQFDAMVSLAYNIGNGGAKHQHGTRGFDGSTVLREHIAGHYGAAADGFLLWNKAAGHVLAPLTRRRKEERALYLSDLPGMAQQPSHVPPIVLDSVDDEIRAMQQALDDAGFDPGPIDGDFGPRTYAAIRAYEARR
jgi:lysozyme